MNQSYNPRYLRKRPFLIVEAIHRPAQGVRTERKGWAMEPKNWSVFERPYVVDCVTPNMLTRAQVIIDLHQRTVVKNRFIGTDVNEVRDHYLNKYAEQCAEAINIWIAREVNRKASIAA